MTGSSLTLVHRTLIILLITLLSPAAAPAQEQSRPQVTASQEAQEEKPAGEQSRQEADTAAPQQGSLVVPEAGETAASDASDKEAAKPRATEADGIYIIRQGDTLWDISNAFMKDPFLWPFIWKANPAIVNPDLIYPGNKLAIPNMAPIERAIQSPAEQEQPLEKQIAEPDGPAAKPAASAFATPRKQAAPATTEEEQAPVNRLIIPEEIPVPIVDKYSMLNAGFVSAEESEDVVVGSPEEKTIMGYDDLVYVTITSRENPSVGDRFLIYKPFNKVKHPVTGKQFGKLIRVLGVLELIEAGKSNTFKARVTLSFDSIDRGSMLTPYQEPSLIYNTPVKAKDISGYILEVVDTRTINAQVDIVYLDKGTADGVEPGDRFLVYKKAEKKIYPNILIGEAQVFLVKERTSTAIVRKSTDALEKGNMIEFKK